MGVRGLCRHTQLTILGFLEMQISSEVRVLQCEQILCTAQDVGRVGGEREAFTVALISAVLPRTEGESS